MKVLFLLPRFPYPLYKGDQLRAYHQLRQLSQHCEVYVFAVSDVAVSEQDKRAIGFVKDFRLEQLGKVGIFFRLLTHFFSNEPFQSAYFHAAKAQKSLDDFIEEIQPDIVFCQLTRMAKYAEKLPKKIKILDYQDTFSVGLARRVQESHFLYRLLLKMEYNRMQAYEKKVFDDFAVKTIISDADRQLLPHPERDAIKLLPNGVDSQHFSPDNVSKTIDLLFTGNMNYPPNMSCVSYLAQSVLPLLYADFPNISFVIAGANPSSKVKELANKNIEVTGFVPDLRTYYNATRIFVAPMQIGIGMQNKILEAMSMGLPCIISSLANAAIQGEHGKHLFVCDNPKVVADCIKLLLEDENLRNLVGNNARTFIKEKYAWEAQNSLLMSWMEDMKN